MQHLKLTFGDIMQSNILYFDETQAEACQQICDRLKIDNMPSIDGKNVYFTENGIFTKRTIEKHNRFSLEQRIFDESVLDVFQKNNHDVVFVFEEEVLQGVVHFCDYNQNGVLQAIQSDILRFERNLRVYLQLCGFSNQSILDYFEVKSQEEIRKQKEKRFATNKLQFFENKAKKMHELGEFQLFDFGDLLAFGNSSFSGKCYTGAHTDRIRELRNMAMHGKNPVSINHESVIFSIDSLKFFLETLFLFRTYSNKLVSAIHSHEEHIDSKRIANKKKLEIIHQHRPKALDFFINHKF